MRTTSSALLPVYHVRGLRVFSTILPKQLRLAQQADKQKSAIALFPELGLSAYAIEDLLFQDALLDAVERAIDQLVEESRQLFSVLVVGAPLRHQGVLASVLELWAVP